MQKQASEQKKERNGKTEKKISASLMTLARVLAVKGKTERGHDLIDGSVPVNLVLREGRWRGHTHH